MNRMRWTRWALAAALGSFLATAQGAPAAAAEPGTSPLDAKCELGITLALAGRTASAESVFVSLLSEAPSDPRPYVNLGNVHFLRGDLDVALVFYDMAIGKDSTDAGIRLNRATTLMLQGEQAAALAEAALAIELAGGPEEASALVGLQQPEAGNGKASDKTYVSKQEVRELLSSASMVPPQVELQVAAPDSLGAPEVQAQVDPVKKRSHLWGSSAPRAADDTEAVAVLYWKY
jgi:Flp pilus assembly protein TadD